MRIFRKLIRGAIYVLSVLVVIFFIFAIVEVAVLLRRTNQEGYYYLSDRWQMYYYAFSILGGVGALLAVVVALFKDGIVGWLKRPDLSVACDLLKPIYNKDRSALDAYSYSIEVKNKGLSGAFTCNLVMVSVKYQKDRKPDLIQDIIPFSESVVKADTKDSFTISNKAVMIEVVRLGNPSNSGVPQGDANAKPILDILGSNLPPDYYEKGLYEIEYEIRCGNDVLSEFSIRIDWVGGEWIDDVARMKNEKKLEVVKI